MTILASKCPLFTVKSVKQTSMGKCYTQRKLRSRPLIHIAVFATLMHVHLYPFDNSSQLLTCAVG